MNCISSKAPFLCWAVEGMTHAKPPAHVTGATPASRRSAGIGGTLARKSMSGRKSAIWPSVQSPSIFIATCPPMNGSSSPLWKPLW